MTRTLDEDQVAAVAAARAAGFHPGRFREFYFRMDLLGGLVVAALAADHPVYQAFHHVAWAHDDELPTFAELARAWHAFYSMPEPDQRRVLNGWTPYPGGRDGELEDYRELIPTWRRVLTITPGKNGDLCHHSVERDADGDAVQIVVQEGTTRSEVLEALERAARVVSGHWDRIIGRDERGKLFCAFVGPAEPAHENGGASDVLPGPLPGSVEDRTARSPAAA